MLLNEFPDIHWLKQQIAANFNNKRGWGNKELKNYGWPTVILNVKSKDTERRDIRGPFSLFFNTSGSSCIQTNKRQVKILDNAFVITNHEEHYDLMIPDKTVITETFNIHFGAKFFLDVLPTLLYREEKLLNTPFDKIQEIPQFRLRSHFADGLFLNQINKIRQLFNWDEAEEEVKEEVLSDLLAHIFFLYSVEKAGFNRLSPLRSSTKTEIMDRLAIAVDYIHCNYSRFTSVEEIAQVACLSKFHFIRLFKEAFRISPYQYLKNVRITRALELLKKGNLTIPEIAFLVGIENGSSLSKIIYKHAGFYPSELRESKISNFEHHSSEDAELALQKS